MAEVRRARGKDPAAYRSRNCAKRLRAILKLAFEDIPQNPASPAYRQGGTLGDDFRHWHRAKFFQQYRLFFRYDSTAKVIIYAWVNDDGSKRAYGSRTDAYRVFKAMLEGGNPPDDWAALRAACERKRRPGALRGKIHMAEDGDGLPPEILAAIEGDDD